VTRKNATVSEFNLFAFIKYKLKKKNIFLLFTAAHNILWGGFFLQTGNIAFTQTTLLQVKKKIIQL